MTRLARNSLWSLATANCAVFDRAKPLYGLANIVASRYNKLLWPMVTKIYFLGVGPQLKVQVTSAHSKDSLLDTDDLWYSFHYCTKHEKPCNQDCYYTGNFFFRLHDDNNFFGLFIAVFCSGVKKIKRKTQHIMNYCFLYFTGIYYNIFFAIRCLSQ